MSAMRLLFTLLAGCLFLPMGKARGDLLFQSAQYAPASGVSGVFINANQFYGVRFYLPSSVVTTSIGGHFGTLSGNMFGAVVRLSGPADYPDSYDLSTSDVLGSAVLNPQPTANDCSTDIVLALSPGWYSLVYGSERFGAHGVAYAPTSNLRVGSPTFFYNGGLGQQRWYEDIQDLRFFLNGQVVPEPSTPLLLGIGAALLGMRWLAKKITRGNV